MPKISVIVPVYNAERYLAECLDSILTGTLKDIEVIAVDDGSIDHSLEILNDYRSRYGITVISQVNSGPASARNAGLEAASGEYIGFVDADDWIEPHMFQTMYEAARQAEADIVFCNILRNSDIPMRKYLESGVYNRDAIRRCIFPLLISNVDENSGKATLRGATWCKLFRRRLITDNGIRYADNLVYNEDGLFSIEATLAASVYVYLGDDYLYHNRVVAGSLTRRFIPNLWERQNPMTDLLAQVTADNDFDFRPQIAKKTLEIAIYCIENLCKSDAPYIPSQRRTEIRSILRSNKVQKAIREISFSGLRRINKLYWLVCKLKTPRLAMRIARRRMKKKSLRQLHG